MSAGDSARFGHLCLEAVSELQIAYEGKAQPDEKAQHIHRYVSILKKAVTPPSGVRWGFETASKHID
ncbi:MAG: hypothetical protein PVF55_02265 [Desulfobacterales bacterium]